LSVHLCTLGSKLSLAERHLLSWIAPRGIVAAAISAFFAIKLEALGYSNAPQLVPLTFMVIIGTVLLQSSTARSIAKKLRVAEPEPRGFLIVGANAVAQTIAEGLKENGFRTLLADQNWSSVKEAKMKGLSAYWGNPVSEHAERHLNLADIGYLLAISANMELNALAAYYYRLEFEHNRIYSIRNMPSEDSQVEEKSEFKFGGRTLFHEEVTFEDLERRLKNGAEIKTTRLTDEFSFDQYLADQTRQRLPLFAIDDTENIHVFSPDADFTPQAGWIILALTQEKVRE